VHRLRITKGSDGSLVPNDKNTTIESTGLRNDSNVMVKDLGPQIAWRTVFIVEYLGPLLIHPIIYALRPYIYTLPPFSVTIVPPASDLQKLSLACICLNFVKRELETLFVHRFSIATMPAYIIIKNSAHYWLLAGLNIAYFTYSPTSPTQKNSITDPLSLIGLGLFVIGELANIQTHLTLRNLRSEGTTERGIPKGLGFNIVTCPNYMFEIMAWLGIWMINRSWSTLVFIVVAVIQMIIWAKKKERKYRKEFGDKYKKKRFTMIPGIV